MSARVSSGLTKALKKLQNLAETWIRCVRSFAEKGALRRNGGRAPSRAKPSGGSAPVSLATASSNGTKRAVLAWNCPLISRGTCRNRSAR